MTASDEASTDAVERVLAQEMAEVLDLDQWEVTANAHFYDDLDGHSLQKMELATRIEERFGVKIPDLEIAAVNTLSGYVGLIMNKLKPGA